MRLTNLLKQPGGVSEQGREIVLKLRHPGPAGVPTVTDLPAVMLPMSEVERENAERLAREAEEARVREEEFLTAMVKALLLSPRPAFTLPAEIRRAPAGHFALGTRGEPALYAAVQGRLLLGPLTPFLAALLDAPARAEEAAQRHGVSPAVREAACAELAALGLLAR